MLIILVWLKIPYKKLGKDYNNENNNGNKNKAGLAIGLIPPLG